MRAGIRRRGETAVAVLCVLLGAACATEERPTIAVPPADARLPAPQNLSWLSRQALRAMLGASVGLGLNSGYVAMFARDGHIVHAVSSGYADIEGGRPMNLDTRFRIASMTKPIRQ